MRRTSTSHWQEKPNFVEGSGHDIDISTGVATRERSSQKHQTDTTTKTTTTIQFAPSDIQQLTTKQRRKRAMDTESTVTFIMHTIFFAYTFTIWFGELLILPRNEIDWCHSAQNGYPNVKRYDNPDYNNNPCYKERPWQLLFMSQMETNFARRMFSSVLMGAAIGFERKASDRPAGIRTMSLVCLGACFFTMCGQLAFRSSTMGFDAARVSAAVPSGVGFLGAGLIWKGTVGTKGTLDERHEVHGLTTAASVWLSAAVGVGVGGRLYIVSTYAVALVILVLRLGPRIYFQDDASSYADDDDYSDGSESLSEGDDDYLSPADEPVEEDDEEGDIGRASDDSASLLRDEAVRGSTTSTSTRSSLEREVSKGSLMMGSLMMGIKKSSSCPSFRRITDDDAMADVTYKRSDSANIEEFLASTRSEGIEEFLASTRTEGIFTTLTRRRQKRQSTTGSTSGTGHRGSAKLRRSRTQGVSFHN